MRETAARAPKGPETKPEKKKLNHPPPPYTAHLVYTTISPPPPYFHQPSPGFWPSYMGQVQTPTRNLWLWGSISNSRTVSLTGHWPPRRTVGAGPENGGVGGFCKRNAEGGGSHAFQFSQLVYSLPSPHLPRQEVLTISRDGALTAHTAQYHPLSLITHYWLRTLKSSLLLNSPLLVCSCLWLQHLRKFKSRQSNRSLILWGWLL